MAITLGQIKQYAVEEASQHITGASATRKVIRWIQQALLRLASEREWKHFQTVTRVNLDPEEAGVGLAATEGSASISRTPTAWAAKYLSEGWDLIADADTTIAYQLSAIGTPTTNATLGTGQVWLADNLLAADGGHTMTRWRYPLPGSAVRQVYSVEVLPQRWPIGYVTPMELDHRRATYPSTRHSSPEVFTIRGTYLEIWPALGTERRALSVSYLRVPTIVADDEDDLTTEIDWPDHHLEVLRAAVILEASHQLGEAAKVPLSSAMLKYKEALGRTETQDSQIAERATRPTLLMDDDGPTWRRARRSDLSPFTDYNVG